MTGFNYLIYYITTDYNTYKYLAYIINRLWLNNLPPVKCVMIFYFQASADHIAEMSKFIWKKLKRLGTSLFIIIELL